MSKIAKIHAREILDSRGNPTVEVEIITDDQLKGWSSVPSGASTGTHEAHELRDNDENRYGGKGVLQAVKNVNTEINNLLLNSDPTEQMFIDQKLIDCDGTENKSRLGANAILGVSLAVARLGAQIKKVPLYKYIQELSERHDKDLKIPTPMFNIINGGLHADSGLCIQEFKLIPCGITPYNEQLRAGAEIFHTLQKMLKEKSLSTAVGDEGGFAPHLESNTKSLEILNEAIAKAGYVPGVQIAIGIDAAASSFYDEMSDEYMLMPENEKLTKQSLIEIYDTWIKKYNLISIEDGLMEEDWSGWRTMTERLGNKTMIIGDDLLVTNVNRLKKAIEEKACNAILIKLNQIGTLSETLECMKYADKNNMKTIVSHRSGETIDDFIADLSVGAGASFIKTGSLSRGERLCKYNRLLHIEEKIKQITDKI